MVRTDIHRPSVIDVGDYEWVGQEHARSYDIGECMMIQQERARINAHMERTGGTYSDHAHAGNCMVCGNAQALYTVLFYHAKTNTYVRMGQDCAMKCDMGNERAFRTFRSSVQDALQRKAGLAKAQAELGVRNLDSAWAIFNSEIDPNAFGSNAAYTVKDIVGKLVQYGSLSDKQYAFLVTLVDQIAHAAETQVQRAKEEAEMRANGQPVVEGRGQIVGTVLSVKVVDSDYGPTEKMLLRDERGFKVYGSVPSGLRGVERGEQVTFVGTVKRSDDDEFFGFFSRPFAK